MMFRLVRLIMVWLVVTNIPPEILKDFWVQLS